MPSSKSANKARRGYQLFVSHATTDKWLATVLCEKIEAAGARAFRDDRDIHGGDDIPETIRSELARSRELLILLTPDSIHRPWVLIELGAYWGRRGGQRIVAVLCHVAFDTIPDMIKSKKAIPLNKLDDYFEELGKRVRKVRS
ncbi:MAG TPA: toll/interleukin-1 receptor domain-containing protein [Pirellulaceae bacterium]|nr:toll/interleukin-1 receptor domain-containing protein [Pirellulaceae bacterium]